MTTSTARVALPKHNTTIEKEERSGVWVCQANSGWSPARIAYHTETGQLTAKHWKFVPGVLIPRPGTRGQVRGIWFYRRKRLAALDQDPNKARSEKCKAWWKQHEYRVIDGVLHARAGKAAELLGTTRKTMRMQAPVENGEPRGDGVPITPVMEKSGGSGGPLGGYYPVPTLKKKKKLLDTLNTRNKGEVSLNRACSITGLSRWTLSDSDWCEDNGITQIKRTALRKRNRNRVAYSFIESELRAFKGRTVPVPKGRMTVSQAAIKLGISEGCTRSLCRKGRLGAIRGDVPGSFKGRNAQKGWLPLRTKVKRIAAFLRQHANKYEAGRALAALARAESAAQDQAPVADTSLPSQAMPAAAGRIKPGERTYTERLEDPTVHKVHDRENGEKADRTIELLTAILMQLRAGIPLDADSRKLLAQSTNQLKITPPPPDTIIAHGKGIYTINGSQPVAVLEPEEVVLQAFLKCPAMDTDGLLEHCHGVSRPDKVLAALEQKYDGIFAPAIRRARRKGKGGHAVAICTAEDARDAAE